MFGNDADPTVFELSGCCFVSSLGFCSFGFDLMFFCLYTRIHTLVLLSDSSVLDLNLQPPNLESTVFTTQPLLAKEV